MSHDKFWATLTGRNRHWLTDGANLTPDGVRKLVKAAYDAGHSQGIENGRALQAMTAKEEKRASDRIKDLLGL